MGASLHSWRKNVLHLVQGRINELWEECEQPSKLRKGKECEQPSKSRKGKERKGMVFKTSSLQKTSNRGP
jgi:hypothetical protein